MNAASLERLSPAERRALLARALQAKNAARRTFPLSYAQSRLWFLDRFQPGDPTYNLPAVTRLQGHVDPAVLQRCLDELVRRHESLRTTFDLVRGAPVQVVSRSAELKLAVVDLRSLDEAAREAEAQRLIGEECRRPFDLVQGPLLRMTLYALGGAEAALAVVMHHIVSDGWSIDVLFEELGKLYEAFSTGRPSPLPELPIQYADFAHWQRTLLQGQALEGHLSYWRKQLAGLPPLLALPADRPRPAVQSHRGAHHACSLEPVLMERLEALGQREGATSFMLLLSAFAVLLHRMSGETDIAIGSPIANRLRPEVGGLIGFFVNTLVLRADLSGDPTFRQLLARTREVALDAFAHQDLPFEKLVEELRPDRNLGHNPLFQVMFVLQNLGPRDRAGGAAAATRSGASPAPLYSTGTAKFDLTLAVTAGPAGAQALFEYSLDVFEAPTIERLARCYRALLWSIAEDPDRPIASLPLVEVSEPAEERLAPAARPGAPRADQAVAAQAARAADAVAVEGAGASLAYGELDRRSNQLARWMRALGAAPGARVGILLEPSPDSVVATLGVLKASAAFVPLDPLNAAAAVEALQPELVLSSERLAGRLSGWAGRVIALDRVRAEAAAQPSDPPEWGTPPDGDACILPRPGRDGRPLGVAFSQSALAAACQAPELGLGPADRLAFPGGLWEEAGALHTLAALAAGARLVLLPSLSGLAPRKLAMHLRDHGVTLAALPTPLLERLGREFPWALRTLRLVLWTGTPAEESALAGALPPDVLGRVRRVYGWTEVGGIAAMRPLSAEHARRAGEPVPGAALRLLDGALGPVPPGMVGALYVSGERLASRYHRAVAGADPAAPDQPATFVQDPLTGLRLVRTGDLARRGPDGALELVGRRDGRVLAGGTRVELEEVEAALRTHPEVAAAAVVERAGARLTGVVVAADGRAPAAADLRRFLLERLPEPAVPATFAFLDALPRAPSGGPSRRAILAELDRRDGVGPAAAAPYAAPRNEVEETLARIWAEAFGVERVGIHDDFFRLGGHSLLGTQVVARAGDALGADVPLRWLFEAPTIAQLARAIERLERGADRPPPIRRAPRDRPLPLSFAQQRLWFLDQFEPGSAFYNIPLSLRVRGALDVAALQGGLDALVGRHEALRTAFQLVDQQPVQVIAPPRPVELPVTDLRSLPGSSREAEAQRLAAAEARRPFDLSRGPLLRARVLRLDDADHVLLLTVHHIVADAWSMDVLFRELNALYEAGRSGREAALPPLEIQYADYAAWQRQWLSGPALEAQLSYWKEHLREAPPVLALPTDRPRPRVQVFRGGIHRFTFPPAVAADLQRLCKAEGCTLFMGMMAAFAVLLHRSSGQDDLVVGTPIANRIRPELAGLIGFFTNTLPMRTRVSGAESFRQLLAQVREVALGAYAHQSLPFEMLVEELNPDRSLAHNPIFQVMLAQQNVGRPAAADGARPSSGAPAMGTGTAKFDLILFVTETTETIEGGFEYDSDLFDLETVAAMAGHLQNLLAAAMAAPDAPVARLSMLSPQELAAFERWNDTRAPLPDLCVHELFAEQVERTPDAPAVALGERALTYRQLQDRALALADRLRGLGVAPGDVVGICLDRSPEMAVAVLAVLAAGAAYLPLDPRFPRDRLAFMISDAKASLVLAGQRARARLPPGAARLVDCGAEEEGAAPRPATRVDPDSLAYVIFTSGSTGVPKGVAMPHRPLVNLVRWQIARSNLPAGARTLQLASLSFDVSFQELFSTWCAGGTVVLATDEERRDPEALWRLLGAAGIHRLFLPYVALQQLADRARDLGGTPQALREVITAGEQLQVTPSISSLFSRLQATLYNQYGPTESHVVTELALAGPAASWPARPSIGRPIPNATIHLLDRWGQRVPAGVPGELHIGGAALARGYLRRPEATAARFIPDELDAPAPGGRLYRTGDRARALRDGTIELLGRVDEQVKVRGHRVEPGEVEARLRQHPAVKEAAVVARPEGGLGLRLVAYVQVDPDRPVQVDQLREWLAASLPEPMVPSAFVVLDAMPLTPTGKLDRRSLPDAAGAAAAAAGTYVAPRTPVEEQLARIWAELLQVPRVGVHDEFFALGGHSLLATRLVSRIRSELGAELPLRRVFEAPTVEQQAVAVVQARIGEGGEEEAARILAELEALSPEEARDQLAAAEGGGR